MVRVALRRAIEGLGFGQARKSLEDNLGQAGFFMNKATMNYFENEDILHLAISDEEEASSIELGPNLTAELDKNGELIGIEILEASSFIRDSILETDKVLNLPKAVNLRNP